MPNIALAPTLRLQPAPVPPQAGEDQALLRLARQSGILGFLPEADLAPLLRHAGRLALRPRETLFTQGEAGNSLILMLQGYMKLSSVTPCGREIVLEIAGPGRSFGELAVLNDWARGADATALSACRVLCIDGRKLMHALMRSPDALLAATRLVSQRLRAATELILDGIALPAPARLAKALLQLAALQSQPDGDETDMEFVLSQRDLGGMTDLTRDGINKHLSAWSDAGWIRQAGKFISLTDIAALQRVLGGHALV